MKLTYIPYSIRNNITDPDLAGLLDYLERDLGWDIFEKMNYKLITNIISKGKSITIMQRNDGDIAINYHFDSICMTQYALIEKDLFFATYRCILPAIRDLYRNM